MESVDVRVLRSARDWHAAGHRLLLGIQSLVMKLRHGVVVVSERRVRMELGGQAFQQLDDGNEKRQAIEQRDSAAEHDAGENRRHGSQPA